MTDLQKMLPLHQREKQQPVFKPLSNNENTHAFILETTPRVKMPTTSLSRNHDIQIASTIQRQNTNQDQAVGTERLSSLHAKLHQEADKIRKWKVQTEIDLKTKEKKIQEASGTIENLRKSILELQLQNENLSLKLQDEMSNREVTSQKISATRELCNILKDHTVKLEERLVQCETERTELKYVGKEHLQQFEELSAKFKELQITAIDNHNNLVNQLQVEREDRSKLEEQMAMKLGDAENQLKDLMDKCDEKDIEIRNVRTIMQKNDDKIHTMEQTVEHLQKKITEQVTDIEEKQKLYDESSTELASIKQHRCSLEAQLSSICQELSEMKEAKLHIEQAMLIEQNQHEVTLTEIRNEVEVLSITLQQEKHKNTEYERQLSESSALCENLKSSRDILIIEKTELENKIVDMQNSLDLIKEQCECDRQKINQLQEEYATKEKELLESQQTCNDLKNQISELEKYIQEKEHENSSLQDKLTSLNLLLEKNMDELQKVNEQHQLTENQVTKLQEDIDDLRDTLNVERENVKTLTSNYSSVKKELETKGKQLLQIEKDFSKLKKENEKVTKDCKCLEDSVVLLKLEIEKTSAENECLLTKVEELETENAMLKEEREEVDLSLTKEIKSKTQKMTDLEVKVKELKSEATHKNKQIKELEKEAKSLKSKLAAQVRATEEKDDTENGLREELDNLKSANQELEKQLNTATETAEKEQMSADDANKKVIEMKHNVEMALKEKQEAIQKCDLQFAEMMATLEKYKQENQKIVLQKEKELELLRSKSDELSLLKQQNGKETEGWKTEADNWKKEAEESKLLCEQEQTEKNRLVKEVEKKQATITKLETTLSSKNTEIKDLKKRKQKAESKKTCSNHETQTAEILESSSAEKNAVPEETQTVGTPSRTQQEIPHTPIVNIIKTPQTLPKSAQRSILKNVSSVSKRRKVAFAKHDDSGIHQASESDSSSSELMEIELSDIDNHFKNKGKSTPVHIRPSPKLRMTPEKECYNTPQPKLVNLKSHKEKSSRSLPKTELQSFKELYPDKSQLHSEKPTETGKENLKPNIRKTPSKTSKFFKDRASQKEKTSKMKKHEETEYLAWFDLDSVFGFGAED
ncbi:synaptonemal complex protein 1-like isoform X2 [Gigantopelta aegis]|nr:synaptonemal complex protein 1-like isoform X2 [Gigantopelta aegis]